MTIITEGTKNYSFHRGYPDMTYYPLHVDDLDTHRPLSHRYSVFEQFRYCETIKRGKSRMKSQGEKRIPHEAGSSDPSPKESSFLFNRRKISAQQTAIIVVI